MDRQYLKTMVRIREKANLFLDDYRLKAEAFKIVKKNKEFLNIKIECLADLKRGDVSYITVCI